MESQPVELLNHISPGDWGSTPASIQRLVEDLLLTAPGSVQSILALQAQIQREKALNRVVQAIRNSLDLDTIFATATAEAAQLMAPFDCYVSQYVAEAGLWRTVAEYRHNSALPPTLGYEIPDADNPVAAQLHRLETVRLDNTSCIEDAVNQTVAETTPGAWLLTPVVVDGQLWGSFSIIANQRPFTWASEQIELAQAVAHQLEVAIQQAHLYRQVQLELEERRRVEAALEESQARLEAVADNVPGVLYGYRLRPDGSDQFIYISSGFREIYGVEADGALADANLLWCMVHPEDVALLRQTLEWSYRTLDTWRVEYRVITPSGQIKWLQGIARPTPQPNGDVVWDGLMIDISKRARLDAERHQAEQALLASEQKLSTLISNLPGYVYRVKNDPNYTPDFISQGVVAITGYAVDDYLVHRTISCGQEMHPEDVGRVWEQVQQAVGQGQPYECEYRLIAKTGQEKWVWERGRGIYDDDGTLLYLEGFVTDISSQKRAEAALRDSEARFRLLAESANDLVCLHSPTGQYLYVSPSCVPLLGYGYSDMRGQTIDQFVHPDDCDRIKAELQEAIQADKATPLTYRVRHRQGHYLWFETLIRSIVNGAGQVVQLQTTSRDVTDRVLAQRQLEHDALHDSLTGLPNRHQLMERLALALDRAQTDDQYQFAVLFLDLDRFKVINDSLGHQAGDQMLVAIAAKLETTLRSLDLAARLGGDEFVVLVDQIDTVHTAVAAAERIFAALSTSFTVAGREVYTTASIGIVMGHRAYNQAEHLLRDADIAMYQAKGKGKARYEIFSAQMHTQAMARLHLEHDLRRAINTGEMVLHYQPIVSLATGAIIGFEVLTRWQHPVRGLVGPDRFIPLAEELGLISCLDYWTLTAACQQLVVWQQRFSALGPLTMGVNLSAQDLRQPDLLAQIDQVLATTGLPGACLTLEITESMLIDDIEATIALLAQIKTRGVRVSIDDFGTGYSSLSYLHRLPVNYLKVDRCFVNPAPTEQANHPIVATIMALGTQLGLETVAEGIETPDQLEHLRSLGYSQGQGYLFSRPLPPDQIADLLTRQPLNQVQRPGE